MFDWSWSAWGRKRERLYEVGGTLTNSRPDLLPDAADESMLGIELIRQQARVQRELELQQWQKAELLQRGSAVLATSGLALGVFGVGSSSNAFFAPTVVDYWVEYALVIDAAVRDVDDRITSLRARLRILSRRIQTILGILLVPKFLYAVVSVQSRFYICHGNHPPRLSGLTFLSPFRVPGAPFA